jgi:endo-1,4-beta-D-glucanase Y
MKSKNMIIVSAIIIILASTSGIIFAAYHNTVQEKPPIVFSKNEMLLDMWNSYKKTNIETETGRSVDRDQDNISTSEGQSYAMLRAVWMDDRETFDSSFNWAKKNIQRTDSLFSWRYGPTENGNYGIQIALGGNNTATDGDSDIALALLMAYSRWNEPRYLAEAKPIINSIWAKEVVLIQGSPVLVANDLERNATESVIVNPSYFSPYAYRIFSAVDKQHDWSGVVDSSYRILSEASKAPLGSDKSSGLAPDWIRMNRATGKILPPGDNLTTNYGYDAMRVAWRVALDSLWYNDPRSKEILNQFSLLKNEWNKNSKLAATYSHSGKAILTYESPAMYGTAIGYFQIIDSTAANKIYTEKLQKLYDPDQQAAIEHLSYYDANWVWFGLAMHQNALPNLTRN